MDDSRILPVRSDPRWGLHIWVPERHGLPVGDSQTLDVDPTAGYYNQSPLLVTPPFIDPTKLSSVHSSSGCAHTGSNSWSDSFGGSLSGSYVEPSSCGSYGAPPRWTISGGQLTNTVTGKTGPIYYPLEICQRNSAVITASGKIVSLSTNGAAGIFVGQFGFFALRKTSGVYDLLGANTNISDNGCTNTGLTNITGTTSAANDTLEFKITQTGTSSWSYTMKQNGTTRKSGTLTVTIHNHQLIKAGFNASAGATVDDFSFSITY